MGLTILKHGVSHDDFSVARVEIPDWGKGSRCHTMADDKVVHILDSLIKLAAQEIL
jgi:hypothetical protein